MKEREKTFKEIFEKNRQKVFHLCYGYTGDADTANDLVQETFVKVWQSLDKFRFESQISTWIYRITVNTCLSYLRSEKKKKNTDEINDELLETHAEETSEHHEQVNLLYKSISLLEENERIIITMVLDEIPYPEIAQVAGISEGNLRVRIHRIKAKLTEIYNRHERF